MVALTPHVNGTSTYSQNNATMSLEVGLGLLSMFILLGFQIGLRGKRRPARVAPISEA